MINSKKEGTPSKNRFSACDAEPTEPDPPIIKRLSVSLKLTGDRCLLIELASLGPGTEIFLSSDLQYRHIT